MSDEVLANWRVWLERIKDDVVLLHADRQIWREIKEMIDQNDRIPERQFIARWITQQAVEALALGIRRQNDKRDDVVSLARLLLEIRDDPKAVMRTGYQQICSPENDTYLIEGANSTFDEWAGEGRDEVDPSLVQDRIDRLSAASTKVREYVNKKRAHADVKDPPTSFTFDELDVALDEIGRVLQEVELLLNCVSLTSPEPTIQTPYRRSFYVPWGPPDEIDKWAEIQEAIARTKG